MITVEFERGQKMGLVKLLSEKNIVAICTGEATAIWSPTHEEYQVKITRYGEHLGTYYANTIHYEEVAEDYQRESVKELEEAQDGEY